MLRRELRGRPVTELVGVHTPAETGLSSGPQHGSRLVDVECTHLAEHVDPPRARSACGEHLPADEVDVGVGAIGVLRWHGVGAEKRRVLREPGGEPDEPPLVLDVQPIAGLHLDMRRARSERRVPAFHCVGAELLGRRGAGRRDRRHDPAGRVGRARHPRREFVGAVTGEHEVRVAVDETRDHAGTVGADAFVGRRAGALDADDSAGVDDERGVPHRARVGRRLVPDHW